MREYYESGTLLEVKVKQSSILTFISEYDIDEEFICIVLDAYIEDNGNVIYHVHPVCERHIEPKVFINHDEFIIKKIS